MSSGVFWDLGQTLSHWPLYLAQFKLHSPTEAKTCVAGNIIAWKKFVKLVLFLAIKLHFNLQPRISTLNIIITNEN